MVHQLHNAHGTAALLLTNSETNSTYYGMKLKGLIRRLLLK